MSSDEITSRRVEVSRVKAENEQDILKLPNVTGLFTGTKVTGGVDTGEIAIVVTVSNKKDVPAKSRIPATINGVPTDVIEEVIRPQAGAMVRLETLLPMVDATSYDTLEGGMSIGPCRSIYMTPPDVDVAGNYVFVGTLGCIVADRANNQPMLLSNFHVMCLDSNWSVGDTMAQPSLVDGGSCPPDTVGRLQRAQLTSSVDAAISSIDSVPFSYTILEIGRIGGTAEARIQSSVQKRGRTTGLTYGTVVATDYTTTVDYGPSLGSITFTDQIRVKVDEGRSSVWGQKGDSGSVVLNDDNYVIGLHFAGDDDGVIGVANAIKPVLDALDVKMVSSPLKTLEKEFLKDWITEKGYTKSEKDEFKEWDIPTDWNVPVFYPPYQVHAMAAARSTEPTQAGMDFSHLPPGDGPNPVGSVAATAYVLDARRKPFANSRILNIAGMSGLDLGYQTEVKFNAPAGTVRASIWQTTMPVTLEAYNVDGSLAGLASSGEQRGTPQTLTVSGTGIDFVRITSQSADAILHWISGNGGCATCDDVSGKVNAKSPTKELTEQKPFKEYGEGWSAKSPTKEMFENKVIREFGGDVTSHFIPEAKRPNLSQGALLNEDDSRNNVPLRRQRRR